MVVVRQGAHRAVQAGLQLGDQHVPQHRASVGLGMHVVAGEPAAQLCDNRIGDGRAEVGDQQRVFHLLPGILVEIATADESQQTAAQRILRFGEPAAESLQPTLGRRDVLSRGRRFCRGRGRILFGEFDIGDRTLRRFSAEWSRRHRRTASRWRRPVRRYRCG